MIRVRGLTQQYEFRATQSYVSCLLLRLGRTAKCKEHGAKRNSKNLLIHLFSAHAFRLTAHASSNHFVRSR